MNWQAVSAIRTEFGQAITEWSNIDSPLNLDWHDWRNANNFIPTSWVNVAPGKANRWERAMIYVNVNNVNNTSNPIWTSSFKKATIVHELGHAYGLHERYNDKNRISALYKEGFYDLQTASWNGTNLVSTWKDQTWNEWSLHLLYYKWVGSSWIFRGTAEELVAVGVHQTTTDRTITTRNAVKASWGAGTYQVCGFGWNGTRDNGDKVVGGGE